MAEPARRPYLHPTAAQQLAAPRNQAAAARVALASREAVSSYRFGQLSWAWLSFFSLLRARHRASPPVEHLPYCTRCSRMYQAGLSTFPPNLCPSCFDTERARAASIAAALAEP